MEGNLQEEHSVFLIPGDGSPLAVGFAGPAGHVAVVVVAVQLVPGVGDGVGMAASIFVVKEVVGLLGEVFAA